MTTYIALFNLTNTGIKAASGDLRRVGSTPLQKATCRHGRRDEAVLLLVMGCS